MVSLFKAVFPAALLTWVIATIMGSNGSKGGFLFIHHIYLSVGGINSIYWSWPLFIASAGLAFAVFKMLD